MTTPLITIVLFFFLLLIFLFCLSPLILSLIILVYAFRHRQTFFQAAKNILKKGVVFFRDIWYNSSCKS